MKIVLLMDNPIIPTGYASTCRLTARELGKRGHEVYAVAFNGGSQYDKVTNWDGINIIPNYALERDKNAIYGDAACVIRINEEIKPDILFFHNDSYRYSYLEGLPADLLAKSVFWLPFEGHEPDFVGVKLFEKCAATRFVTNHALGIHKDMLKGKDIGYIPHAVDMEHLAPPESKLAAKAAKQLGVEGKFLVTRVDRHQPRKYWDRTLKAFARFAEGKDDVFLLCKCDPRDVTMWDAAKKEGTDLEALARELGIDGKVKFDDFFFNASYMPRAFYQPADVFLTTTSGEGFGLTACESMACGTPVIYPKTPVLPEIVGDCGIPFDIEGKLYFTPMHVWHNLSDVKAAAAKLEWAYQDWKNGSPELKRLGGMAAKKVADTYSPKVVYDQWEEVLKDVSERLDLVSVVTVVYNLKGDEQIHGEDGIDKLRETMEKYVSTPYEWVIVDNGSPQRDLTRKWMASASAANRRIKPVYLDDNLGFAGGNNEGIAKTLGKWVVLCNPDSEALDPKKQNVRSDCLRMMVDKAKSDPRIGVVGMQINKRDDICPGLAFPYFCNVLLTRKCLDAIRIADDKWLDEKFFPAYYEDAAICMMAQRKGFKVVEDKYAPWYHKSGGTNKYAIEGGPQGPFVQHLRNDIEKLEKSRPDMADWPRKRAELAAQGQQGLIAGNIAYLNKMYGMEARSRIKVVWEGHVGYGDGFSQLMEGLAPAMDRLGFDVYVNDWSNGANIECPDMRRLAEKYKRANVGEGLDDAIHIVCFLMETFLNVDASYKVGISLCESTKVRESYLQACNSMDRILTFSEFCRGVQVNSGYKVPIDVIPPGVNPIFMNYYERPTRNGFTFLSVGVSQERKDTRRLVEAFCEAFPRGQDRPPEDPSCPLKCNQVELVLKSNNFGELNWVEPFKKAANIRTIFTGNDQRASRKDFSMQEMYDLYCSVDCLVHPSHGEGIGMPICEAAATGLPAIFTNWSTPAELFDETNSYPCSLSPYPGTTFTKAYPGAPGDNGLWANIHIGHMKHLMYQVIRERDKAREIGRKAHEHVMANLNWKNSAERLMPLVFEWESERQAKTKVAAFDPMTFEKPKMDPVRKSDRVMIDVVSRDRHSYLCSLVTSLLAQSFKEWDIIIECDDSDESMPNDFQIMSLMHRCGHEGHGWRIIRSHRQGPHMAHDRTLQMTADDPSRKYKLICRIDDDIIVRPDFLEKLFSEFENDGKCEVGAVSGVYLDPRRGDGEQTAPKGWETDINYSGSIDHNVPWPYICRYPAGTTPRPVEHLYSSFMFRVEVARAIGGYCKRFSQIGHREESDFSYRFHLAGYRLNIHPEAVGYHFSAPGGGIRSGDIVDRNQLASMDHQIYQRRVDKWKKRAFARRLKDAEAKVVDHKDQKISNKMLAVVNGSSPRRLRDACSMVSAMAEEVYATCSDHKAKDVVSDLPCVKMVATTQDEAALLTKAIASDGDHGLVMTISDTMKFEGDPIAMIDDDHDEWVFEVYKTYLPGRTTREASSGTPMFVQDDSIGTVIGPEVTNQCLIHRKDSRLPGGKPPRIKYVDMMVLDDVRLLPVDGKSYMGNELIPMDEASRRPWRKICTWQHPEGRISPPRAMDVRPTLAPLVSIVIPTHGRLEHLKRCLSSIYSHTRTSFEVIVVDNGSSDGTAEWLDKEQKTKANLVVLRQQVNLGYQKAINIGLAPARGEFLLLWNDDAWVERLLPDGRDWLRAMVDELASDPGIGIVGPHGGRSPALGTDMLYFWCVMMRRSTYDKVGPLDDATFHNYGGDDDYAERTRKSGMAVKVLPLFEGVLRHLMNLEAPEKKAPEIQESQGKLREKYGMQLKKQAMAVK